MLRKRNNGIKNYRGALTGQTRGNKTDEKEQVVSYEVTVTVLTRWNSVKYRD